MPVLMSKTGVGPQAALPPVFAQLAGIATRTDHHNGDNHDL